MKTIMISVNPPHAGNLVDEVKTVEWRTKPLPCPCKALVYETKKYGGSGKVIGEVEVAGRAPIRVTSLNSHYFKGFIRDGMVGIDFLEKYAKSRNAELLYANVTQSGKRYEKPKELSEFGIKRPFQSWGYVYDRV